MKFRVLLFFVIISIKLFSQNTEDFLVYPVPFTQSVNIQFKVVNDDSISLNLQNVFGIKVRDLISHKLLKQGIYNIKYTPNSLNSGKYYIILNSSTNNLIKNIVKEGVIDSVNKYDLIEINYTEKNKITDTVKVVVYDTTKILIIDTLNCNNIQNINVIKCNARISITKSILISDKLIIDSELPDYIEIYDMSGKYIKRFNVKSSVVPCQNLIPNVYIGLYYKNKNVINSIRIVKE